MNVTYMYIIYICIKGERERYIYIYIHIHRGMCLHMYVFVVALLDCFKSFFWCFCSVGFHGSSGIPAAFLK